MLFSKGMKVRLVNSGDVGTITQMLPDEMAEVFLPEDDMSIPCYLEDLAPYDYFNKSSKEDLPPKEVKETIEKTQEPSLPNIAVKPEKGLSPALSFDPKLMSDGTVGSYIIYLSNPGTIDYIYIVSWSLNQQLSKKMDGQLKAGTLVQLGYLQKDELNDSPRFTLELRQVTTDGSHVNFNFDLKIKAQKFFKKLALESISNKEMHVFPLACNNPKNEHASLKDYTKVHTKSDRKSNTSNYYDYENNDLSKSVAFPNQIDLHIEKLTPLHEKMIDGEKLAFQLRRFETYILDAIRFNKPFVYIIHGKGKGVLRNKIIARLNEIPEVDRLEESMDYGNTKVIFKSN